MTRIGLVAGASTCALFLTNTAMAMEPTEFGLGHDITIQQAASMLHYSGGNDRYRVEIAPNYSEELGFSLKGAVGGYLTDALALGLIVEYGENKREYLANAGIQFNDALSFAGTVGMLEEHNEYVDGEDRERVQQMEYGASFKGAYEIGFLSALELNGYLTDADADSDSVETGKLYGVQLLTDLDLTDTTHVKIGGGYEWLEWDNTNEDDNHWAFSAEAAQQLGDVISLTGNAKLGASEFVYGGGVALDLSNGGTNTNTLAINYSYIDGKSGIEDDQRVELSWGIGFGAGPMTSVAAADLTDKNGTISAAADVAIVSPSNTLLANVMKRPEFLPKRALAKAKAVNVEGCASLGFDIVTFHGIFPNYVVEDVVTFNRSVEPGSFGVLSLSVRGPVGSDATFPVAESVTINGYAMEGSSGPVPLNTPNGVVYNYYFVYQQYLDASKPDLSDGESLLANFGPCTFGVTARDVTTPP